MKTITVKLPDSLVSLIEAHVRAGEFDSFDNALAFAASTGAIPFSGRNRVTSNTTDDELRSMLQVSLDQYERGESVDGELFMDELERDFDSRMNLRAESR